MLKRAGRGEEGAKVSSYNTSFVIRKCIFVSRVQSSERSASIDGAPSRLSKSQLRDEEQNRSAAGPSPTVQSSRGTPEVGLSAPGETDNNGMRMQRNSLGNIGSSRHVQI